MSEMPEADTSSVKLNLTFHCLQCHASTAVEGCQPIRVGHLLQYLRERNAASTKQDCKRFTSHVRGINLPIWEYYLSMDLPLFDLKGQCHKIFWHFFIS